MLRFEPFRDIDREIERFIEQIQRPKRPVVQFVQPAWRPLVDVFETEDMVVAIVELAGIDENLLDIRVENRALTITGQRGLGTSHVPRSYHLMEINHGPFERTVQLPHGVEPDQTSATIRNGMLEICMPKAQSRSISINVAPSETADGD
jgi:HSP20 family protein